MEDKGLAQKTSFREKFQKDSKDVLYLEDFSADYPGLGSNHLILDCQGAASKSFTEYPLVYDILQTRPLFYKR